MSKLIDEDDNNDETDEQIAHFTLLIFNKPAKDFAPSLPRKLSVRLSV